MGVNVESRKKRFSHGKKFWFKNNLKPTLQVVLGKVHSQC
jgi:hypothetical protein